MGSGRGNPFPSLPIKTTDPQLPLSRPISQLVTLMLLLWVTTLSQKKTRNKWNQAGGGIWTVCGLYSGTSPDLQELSSSKDEASPKEWDCRCS